MITKPSYLKKIFKPGIYRRGFLKRLTALTLGSAVIPLFPAAVRAGVKGIGDDVEALQNVIKGNVITRDNKSYELWRQTMVWWLHKPSRYPDMIVLAKNDVDVVEAIKFARKNQIKVKVRTGGHSYTSSSIFDNGMLIDVSALHSVEIDAEAKLAVIGPGITSEVLLEELNQYGLAFPVAHEATVPMGGYLLGGGIGWNGEGLGGPACFSIRAVELVTPDGELIVADENHNQDWLWAARGAGPAFFGAVTKFHIQLYKRHKMAMTSAYFWPYKHAREVLEWSTPVFDKRSDNVETITFMSTAPDKMAEQCQGDSHGKICMVLAMAFGDSEEETRRLLAPLEDGPVEKCVLKKEYMPGSYSSLFKMVKDESSPRIRMVADSFWSDADPVELLSAVEEHFTKSPSDKAKLVFKRWKPRQYPDAAYSLRTLNSAAIFTFWEDEKDDAPNNDWLAGMSSLLEPFSQGHYVNEVDIVARPMRLVKSFKKENWERIEALRKQYDPKGVFHVYTG